MSCTSGSTRRPFGLRHLIVTLLISATAVIARPAAQLEEYAVAGDWYSEGSHDVLSLQHFETDGTFRIEFRECLKHGFLDHVEAGSWRVSDNHLLMTTELIRDTPVHLTDVLDPLSLDKYRMVLRISGGDALRAFGPADLTLVRVAPDSKLPGCDLIS